MVRLRADRPDFVFNLVETVEGSGRFIHFAPSLLDHLAIPYTGSSTEALFTTSNKLLAKKMLQSSGVRTPQWFSADDLKRNKPAVEGNFIVKSIWEHASIGLDDASVVCAGSFGDLAREIESRREKLGGDCFAEAYIEGREFNLSLLAGENGPDILPPAEIRFDRFPAGKRKLVGYRAKWSTGSFEYQNTPRCFDFSADEEPLIRRLRDIAGECWRIFGLRGYARVDFRVDDAGVAWVLEINANPCLSPDAGFFAASKEMGLHYREVVRRIVEGSICSINLLS